MKTGDAVSIKAVVHPNKRGSELEMRKEMDDLVRAKVEYKPDGCDKWSLVRPHLDIRIPKDQIVEASGRLRALKDCGQKIGVKVKVFGF